VRNRGARLPVTAHIGLLARPQPPGTTAALIGGRMASDAATRARAAGQEVQLCAAVLIAAILLPVIRADGMTPAGVCRDWPMPKIPDDRRGAERVRAGDGAHRAMSTNRKRTVPALDPGGGSRCRPPASSHFHPSGRAAAQGTVLRNASEQSQLGGAQNTPIEPRTTIFLMDGKVLEATARFRVEYRLRWEAVETFKAQELAAMTDERARQIIQSLGAADGWRERRDWSGLVEQQAAFHRAPPA
jgi:hypothetical protein